MKLSLTDAQFWALHTLLVRDVETLRGCVESCRKWQSPGLETFQRFLSERENLLVHLRNSHPQGAAFVEHCASAGRLAA